MLIVGALFAFNMRAEHCGIDTQKSIQESYKLGDYNDTNVSCVFSTDKKIFVSR